MREEADDILYSIGLSDEQKEVQHSIKQVRGSLFKEKIPYTVKTVMCIAITQNFVWNFGQKILHFSVWLLHTFHCV